MKQFVFIDDSGDPGFKGAASSQNFIMAAVLFNDPDSVMYTNNNICSLFAKS